MASSMLARDDERRFSGHAVPGLRHPLREIDRLAHTLRYDAGEPICDDTRHSEFLYRLVSGSAKCRRLAAGREIIDILLPGDYFGFSSPDDKGFVVTALTDDVVAALYPRWGVRFVAEVDPAAAASLHRLEREAASRIRAASAPQRRVTAAAKVSSFVLAMEARLRRQSAWFALPISLNDMADMLALSPWTVRCCLQLLVQQGSIEASLDQRIRVLDRRRLEDVGRGLDPARMLAWPAPCPRRRDPRGRSPLRPSMDAAVSRLRLT